MSLQKEFYMLVNRIGMPGRSRHEIMILGQLEGHAVVENDAVFAQHDSIAAHACFKAFEIVGVEYLDEFERIRPLDLELAQWGAIVNSEALSHHQRFAVDRFLERLTGARVITRPSPACAGFIHLGAMVLVPLCDRRVPIRQVNTFFAHPGQATELDRHVRRTKGRGADFIQFATALQCNRTNHIQVAGLTLVDAHTGGGITFDVLHCIETFAYREMHIGERDVILNVDKTFSGEISVNIDMPQGFDMVIRFGSRGWQRSRRIDCFTDGGERTVRLSRYILQQRFKIENTRSGPDALTFL